MCAGAYLDRDFRQALLTQAYCDRRHRLPPSYGFDLVPVLIHAWRAWALEVGQYVAVLVVLVTAALRAPWETMLAVAVLLLWFTGRGLIQFLDQGADYFRKRLSISEYEQIPIRGRAFWYGFLASLALILVGAFEFLARIRPHDVAHARTMMRDAEGSIPIIALLAAIVAAAAATRQLTLNHLRFGVGVSPGDRNQRLTRVKAQQCLPLTVYSVYKPFIGAGTTVRSWSFAQRLVRADPTGLSPDQEFATPPFRTIDLVNELRSQIDKLRQDRDLETRLPGLQVADHMFIEGSYSLQHRKLLLPGLASTALRSAIENVINDPKESARHYLRCQVSSWGGEVVTSVFAHVSLQGRTLYVEFSTHALEPVRQAYHIIDEHGETGIGSVFRSTGKSIATLPDALIDSIRLVHIPVRIYAAIRAGADATAAPKRGTNIGAEFSAREAASSERATYFQHMDVFKHSKIIERRLIATVGDFLKRQGVDTAEFLRRSTEILNTGVINVQSGQINNTGAVIGQVGVSPSNPAGGAAP